MPPKGGIEHYPGRKRLHLVKKQQTAKVSHNILPHMYQKEVEDPYVTDLFLLSFKDGFMFSCNGRE